MYHTLQQVMTNITITDQDAVYLSHKMMFLYWDYRWQKTVLLLLSNAEQEKQEKGKRILQRSGQDMHYTDWMLSITLIILI